MNLSLNTVHLRREDHFFCDARDGYYTMDPFSATCSVCIEAWEKLVFETKPAQAMTPPFRDEEWDRAAYIREPTTDGEWNSIRSAMEMPLPKEKP